MPVNETPKANKTPTSLPPTMDSQFQNNPTKKTVKLPSEPVCTKPSCFFCAMNEPNPYLQKAKIMKAFEDMPLRNDQEHILELSSLWNVAMKKPNDPEFPSLGIFKCMAKLIHKGINDKEWLLSDQNIYIPYYAAHIIGSYTMNKAQFAEKALKSGVVSPLMELMRGKITWVEQRVAVRALGHMAGHEKVLEAIAVNHEVEIVELAMKIASTSLKEVYDKFIGLKGSKRLKYHCNLLTRGLGGFEIENTKAEEWASQLQCWSLYLLSSFACREKSLTLICKKEFLMELCGMWGGLENTTSPSGIGLLKTLCHSKIGRQSVADLQEVIETLCNVSRSSHDWQLVAIDSLLLLLKDPETRYKVMDIAVVFLVDLVELRRPQKVGHTITQTLLQDYHKIKYGNLKLGSKKAERALEEIWDLKVDRKKREKLMSEIEIRERKSMVGQLKKHGNVNFWSGNIDKAVRKYSEALDLCPLKMRRDRLVLHSNRAQCYLLLRNPVAAISDTTRALCLSSAVSPHGKSLWRRSQAYDMMGLGKESLMDCLTFVNGRSVRSDQQSKGARIPYYAARMINKQMNATWQFAPATWHVMMMMKKKKKKEKSVRSEALNSEAYTSIEEETFTGKRRRKLERARRRKKGVNVTDRVASLG